MFRCWGVGVTASTAYRVAKGDTGVYSQRGAMLIAGEPRQSSRGGFITLFQFLHGFDVLKVKHLRLCDLERWWSAREDG